MTQPTWNTPAGTIGTYTENIPITFNFSASPNTLGNTLIYTLLNGEFPVSNSPSTPFTLSASGVLTGTSAQLSIDITKTFTIRVYEYSGVAIVGFRDRTFSITVTGPTAPQITTLSALGTINDSTWVSIQLTYSNPDNNTVSFRLVNGILPPGIYLSINGLISGYAERPINPVTGAAINKTYEFVIQISGESGSSVTPFTVTIQNQELIPGYVARPPTILNNRPLLPTIDPADIYRFYYFTGNTIGPFNQSTDFYFKFIGYDFSLEDITYVFNWVGTPASGLTFNPAQGWLYGTLPTIGATNTTYTFTVSAYKTLNPSITSPTITYNLYVLGSIDLQIEWLTDSDLGIIYNGDVSVKSIRAVSLGGFSLIYSISGTLPNNLSFDTATGDINGRLAFESLATVQSANQEIYYTFSVTAYSVSNPLVTATKTFTLKTVQKFVKPYDNIYIKSLLNETDRAKVATLLNNTDIIPNDVLYRNGNPYFGKSVDITYNHLYGVFAEQVDEYLDAITQNHYWRNITLGEIKTAVARNTNDEVIYEVVYSEIQDNLIEKNGQSISKQITWPVPIPGLPGTNPTLYPNSLVNMRQQVASVLLTSNSPEVLPLWMTSEQADGVVLGYIPAYIICYTKPGYSSIVKKNIDQSQISNVTVTNSSSADNSFTCSTTGNFYVNMSIKFTGTAFGGVTSGITYFVHSIVNSTKFKIKSSISATTPITLTTSSGSMILDHITWQYKLNEIPFIIDRYEIDKRASYQYDSSVIPNWSSLPSSTITNNSEDFYVIMDKKTIIST